MRVTFIGHASLLIEAKGVRVISDPWWRGPCFGAQWWLYPQPHLDPLRGEPLDYVYVSHGHHDHFHPATLKTFAKGTKVLVAEGFGLAEPVAELGLEPIELGDTDEYELAPGFTCRIIRTDGDDSLMVVSDGAETGLNINDALHSSPPSVREEFARRLKAAYPTIDWVFCGYGVASHFPNCYVIPGKDREATAAKRQRHFNRAWAEVVHSLGPRFAFPFAADVVFLEAELFWSNEPTHNTERPTEAFARLYPGSATRVFDIAPGFAFERGAVLVPRLRERVRNDDLRRVFAVSIRRVNREVAHDRQELDPVVSLLKDNVRAGHPYLSRFPGDYRALIRFRSEGPGIAIAKRGREVSVTLAEADANRMEGYDVRYTTRLPYLLGSLTTEYGHETLFVGSGGMFEYADESKVVSNIHRELMAMVRPVKGRLPSRPEGWRRWPAGLKRLGRSVLGVGEVDLYDLHSWTVFTPSRSAAEGVG